MKAVGRGSSLYKTLTIVEDPSGHGWLAHAVSSLGHAILVKRGASAFKRLRESNPGAMILIVPTASFGDLLMLRPSLDLLTRGEQITVIAEARTRPACEALGYAHIEYVTQLDRIALVLFQEHNRPECLWNALPWYLFNIEGESEAFWTSHYPTMSPSAERIAEITNAAHLVEGKSVVLSPYEQTITSAGYKNLSKEFWAKVATELRARGYVVCTNCRGDAVEPPIQGTVAVFPKLQDATALFDFAGYVVAIMSGIIDFTARSTAEVCCLYPNDDFYDKWGGRFQKVHQGRFDEIVYGEYLSAGDEDALLSRILQNF